MNNSTYNSKWIVRQALSGQPMPRPATGPLAVHYCARLAGVSLRDYTTSAVTMADCIVRYYETFRPDAIWLSADTWVTAQAMGASVAFPASDQPMCGTGDPLIQTPADIDRIPRPDPTCQGRWPLMIEALERVVERIGSQVFVVACFDQYPFSLACALMGIDQVMTALVDDLPMVEAVMQRCAEYATAYAEALARAGADMLSGGDSPAGLIGPGHYRDVARPYERQTINQIKSKTSVPVSLHICGNATPILKEMATTGADVLEIDHQVAMEDACGIIGPETAIWGNIDPVTVLARGSVETVKKAVCRLVKTMRDSRHRRFVLSSGCTLAVETPTENLHALLRAGQELPKSAR